MKQTAEEFIRAHTRQQTPPLLPDMPLYLADEIVPVWKALEEWQGESDLPPPFWAFAWAGGQAQARHILDHPDLVRGRRVLDFASGSGLGAIAAARAGAKKIVAADIDSVAMAALRLNAAANAVRIEEMGGIDMSKPLKGFDVIMAGDVCYEQTMSHRVLRWLRLCVYEGIQVIIADPGRGYAPDRHPDISLAKMAAMTVPTSRELEDRDTREVTIWQLLA